MGGTTGWARIAVAALLLESIAAVAPSSASAACGGGGLDPTSLARRAGRVADTIILGRLLEVDANHDYHFELLEVYRGDPLSSPIDNTYETDNGVGIVDVGGCSGQSVKPGGLFVYATGDRAQRFGPMQLIFPRVPGRGWIIDHSVEYASLDGLLSLLGVLPDTAVEKPDGIAGSDSPAELGWATVAFLVTTSMLYWTLGKRAATKSFRRAAEPPRRNPMVVR
jgi:hypothetical protein